MVDMPWKVQQYCYFWIASEVVTAKEMTAALGMVPDRTSDRGSRRTLPSPVPVQHAWEIVCERHGRIDEQASEVLSRMEHVSDAVQRLVRRGDVEAGLMMVRCFDDSEGGDQAMGWALSSEQVALLTTMGAGIQADEYA